MNKGFTLIELLAVIIILSLLTTLVSTSVVKIVRDSKKNLYKSQLSSIKSAAMAWGADNPDKLPSNGKCNYITLSDLKEYGLLDEKIKNPKNSKEFSDDLKIKITSKETIYGNFNIDYEVDSEDIDNCIYITACKLASDSEKKGTELGAKYDCKVDPNKDPYTFYVLSNNEDETTNLIMDRNICEDGTSATEKNTCLVAWQTSGSNADGPVTAMDYLYKATKDWTNIPNIEMNYIDKVNNGYGTIVTADGTTKITKKDGASVTVLIDQEGYSNLKARLPYRSEVDTSNIRDEYLFENLDGSNWYGSGTKPTKNIDGIYGYWTLSSSDLHSNSAWAVVCVGYILSFDVGGYDIRGVRPVITVKL